MSYIITGDVENKISPLSLNNGTTRDGWEMGQLDKFWKYLSDLIFGGIVRRRGTDVNIPKKGSRGDAFCIGGI
jgi:hypothetical protein